MNHNKVLVVDDNAAVCHALRSTLETLGCEVDTAANGGAALGLFMRERHHLVITDLRMPMMSGWDVIEQLRALDPAVPVIVVSGAVSDEERAKARVAGAQILTKPVRLNDLQAAVQAAIRARRNDTA